jgi:hypothetical protein
MDICYSFRTLIYLIYTLSEISVNKTSVINVFSGILFLQVEESIRNAKKLRLFNQVTICMNFRIL